MFYRTKTVLQLNVTCMFDEARLYYFYYTAREQENTCNETIKYLRLNSLGQISVFLKP